VCVRYKKMEVYEKVDEERRKKEGGGEKKEN
jgi:hypothetical protein